MIKHVQVTMEDGTIKDFDTKEGSTAMIMIAEAPNTEGMVRGDIISEGDLGTTISMMNNALKRILGPHSDEVKALYLLKLTLDVLEGADIETMMNGDEPFLRAPFNS